MLYYNENDKNLFPNSCFIAELSLSDNFDDFLNDCYAKLKFPSYFGFNYHALYDCLADFSWLDETEIKILITSIDCNLSNLKDYIELFHDVEEDWILFNSKSEKVHENGIEDIKKYYSFINEDELRKTVQKRNVQFYFKEEYRETIEKILRELNL